MLNTGSFDNITNEPPIFCHHLPCPENNHSKWPQQYGFTLGPYTIFSCNHPTYSVTL